MVRAKFDYELVRGINKKQSNFQRILHGKGPKKRGPKNPNKGKKFDAADEAKRQAKRNAPGYKKGPRFQYRKQTFHKRRSTDETMAHYWDRDNQPQAKNCRKKKKTNRVPRLRKKLTPGTVVILLAGPCMGRRVIFLKQLQQSGLILTIGPKKANGDSLRRVSQAYVIATSKKVDLSPADLTLLPEVTDEYFEVRKKFKKNKTWKTMTKKKEFIATEKEPTFKPHAIYKQNELEYVLNKQIWRCVKRDIPLRYYLNAKFRIMKNSRPHLMKF